MTTNALDTLLVTGIIGTYDDLMRNNLASPITDVVEIEWFEAARKIMRKTSQNGREVAFRLFSEGQALQHNDVVYNDDVLIIIHIKPCPAIVLRPKTLSSMAQVCYEIGNKHAPLCMDGDELVMPQDLPLFRWLENAGYAPVIENRRLSHMLRSNSHGDAHAHSTPSHPKAPAWTERLARKPENTRSTGE
jgi:urease accessory protein